MRDKAEMSRRRFETSRTHERALAALEGRDSFDHHSSGDPPKVVSRDQLSHDVTTVAPDVQSNPTSPVTPSGVYWQGGDTAHQLRNQDNGRYVARSLPTNAARRHGSGTTDRDSVLSPAFAAAGPAPSVATAGGDKGPAIDMKSLQELESALSDESKV